MAQPIWNTPAGVLGTYPAQIPLTIRLSATAVRPAVTVTYAVISGNLPTGTSMSTDGLITGIPNIGPGNITYSFVVRATDNLQNIKDRTFNIVISGDVAPTFSTVPGNIATVLDSTWFEFQMEYNNRVTSNPVAIRVVQGDLPPGLEINEFGMIRGYASPPVLNVTLNQVNTTAVATSDNKIICYSTTGFAVGRPVTFSGETLGGLLPAVTYYINSIIDETTFTISATAGGPLYTFGDDVGMMNITLPNITVGQPTIKTYSFTLKLESPLGNNVQPYSITVVNQNTPISQGGPGKPPNTRVPTILNTRPRSYDIAADPQEFGYYVLPPESRGNTYSPAETAYIGKVSSDNYFSFKILGYDFDNNPLHYTFADLPIWLTGDPNTGWITGTPILGENSINEFYFSVTVSKADNPAIRTAATNFGVKISNNIIGEIFWISPSDLGVINNGTLSNIKVQATSDVPLSYRFAQTSGTLPPNLTLLSNGEISGVVAYQPTDTVLKPGSTSEFTFTIEAYSPTYSVVNSTKTFTISVYQEYARPTDTLYIKCVPSVEDRYMLASLLNDENLIPNEYLYRPEDPYFGKAKSVIYEHAYGIFSSSFDEYVAAITKNHYWRNITLGEIKTAIARNEAGEIIYEVVYSEVIDNLINPAGQSISKEIYWPRPIPLNLGPWYTSETDIYTSYVEAPNGQQFYTSLTPGYARVLYPNSLPNMRERVGENLGQEYNFKILPSWMTSQQRNGSTLGYTPAWVIAYCKPGVVELNGVPVSPAQYIQYQIQNNWVDVLGNIKTLNTINFKIDRFTVDKSTTFNYDTTVSPPAWTGLPSASPAPDPSDSKNFHVLFPQETILPNKTQYKY